MTKVTKKKDVKYVTGYDLNELSNVPGFDVLTRNIVNNAVFKMFMKAQAYVKQKERVERLQKYGMDVDSRLDKIEEIRREIQHYYWIGQTVAPFGREFDKINKMHISTVHIPDLVIERAEADLDKTDKPKILAALVKGIEVIESLMDGIEPIPNRHDNAFENEGGVDGVIFTMIEQAIDWVQPPKFGVDPTYEQATMFSFFENNYERDVQELAPFVKHWKEMTIGVDKATELNGGYTSVDLTEHTSGESVERRAA
jgi:hypothetical protein